MIWAELAECFVILLAVKGSILLSGAETRQR